MSLQTTTNDWVISGHGSTSTATKPAETTVPAHVRLVLLAPPGAFLSNRLGQALERGVKIDKLVLRQSGRDNSHSPSVYEPGSKAPNLTLHFIGPRDIGTPTVPTSSAWPWTRSSTTSGRVFRPARRSSRCTGLPARMSTMIRTARPSTTDACV